MIKMYIDKINDYFIDFRYDFKDFTFNFIDTENKYITIFKDKINLKNKIILRYVKDIKFKEFIRYSIIKSNDINDIKTIKIQIKKQFLNYYSQYIINDTGNN
jgi:hypothetical protein